MRSCCSLHAAQILTDEDEAAQVLHAERAALLYMKAERKAVRHPAPQGYGNGYSECVCARCTRAMLLEEAAARAYAAWRQVAGSRVLRVRSAC